MLHWHSFMQTSVVRPADISLAHDMSYVQHRSHHGYCVKAQSGPGARLAADAG